MTTKNSNNKDNTNDKNVDRIVSRSLATDYFNQQDVVSAPSSSNPTRDNQTADGQRTQRAYGSVNQPTPTSSSPFLVAENEETMNQYEPISLERRNIYDSTNMSPGQFPAMPPTTPSNYWTMGEESSMDAGRRADNYGTSGNYFGNASNDYLSAGLSGTAGFSEYKSLAVASMANAGSHFSGGMFGGSPWNAGGMYNDNTLQFYHHQQSNKNDRKQNNNGDRSDISPSRRRAPVEKAGDDHVALIIRDGSYYGWNLSILRTVIPPLPVHFPKERVDLTVPMDLFVSVAARKLFSCVRNMNVHAEYATTPHVSVKIWTVDNIKIILAVFVEPPQHENNNTSEYGHEEVVHIHVQRLSGDAMAATKYMRTLLDCIRTAAATGGKGDGDGEEQEDMDVEMETNDYKSENMPAWEALFAKYGKDNQKEKLEESRQSNVKQIPASDPVEDYKTLLGNIRTTMGDSLIGYSETNNASAAGGFQNFSCIYSGLELLVDVTDSRKTFNETAVAFAWAVLFGRPKLATLSTGQEVDSSTTAMDGLISDCQWIRAQLISVLLCQFGGAVSATTAAVAGWSMSARVGNDMTWPQNQYGTHDGAFNGYGRDSPQTKVFRLALQVLLNSLEVMSLPRNNGKDGHDQMKHKNKRSDMNLAILGLEAFATAMARNHDAAKGTALLIQILKGCIENATHETNLAYMATKTLRIMTSLSPNLVLGSKDVIMTSPNDSYNQNSYNNSFGNISNKNDYHHYDRDKQDYQYYQLSQNMIHVGHSRHALLQREGNKLAKLTMMAMGGDDPSRLLPKAPAVH